MDTDLYPYPDIESVPDFPVLIIHFETAPGSKIAMCCDLPFNVKPWEQHPGVEKAMCTGCYGIAKRQYDAKREED
jgi:hypothetical protein